MFELFGEYYYFDLDKVDKELEIKDESVSGETKVHLVKYELVKMFIETILTEGDIDESMGLKSNDISLPFKISFNSLLMKKIINKL
jgi:hypothetical protein